MGQIMAMRNKDFAVFILTHSRPYNVVTYHTLKRQGYTGDIYIVIDNEDKGADEYRKVYGNKVIVFDKAAIAETFDEGDNFQDRRAVVYARNASFEIADKLGLSYILQLDDDYTKFDYRINNHLQYPHDRWAVKTRLDYIFDLVLDYYRAIDAKSIALEQGGDFIAGRDNFGIAKRKCMNVVFCSVDRPFQFIGRVNEDVNTYTCYQNRGNLFLSIPFVSVTQLQTQSNTGGMTELYRESGTYIKSFYTVMYAPSCTHIGLMGQSHRRLHHSIAWDNAVPCIVPESCRRD